MSAVAPTADSLPQETATLDLKREFDPASAGQWWELIKDIVAMANSGGGRIIVGLDDDGIPSDFSPEKILAIDPADFVNKINACTGVHFAGVCTHLEPHAETSVAVLVIGAAPFPLIFGKPGNYQHSDGKQKCAFNPGTLYVRHGAKSEPATSDDIRDILDRHVKRDRDAFLANVRQVVEAPAGSVVSVMPVVASPSDLSARPVRLVSDPTAAPAVMLDPNDTHRSRQKELLATVNAHFAGRAKLTTNDIVAIRLIYKTDEDRSLCYLPNFGSRLYSDAFAQWIITHIDNDPSFLNTVRQKHHEITLTRNASRRQSSRPISAAYSNQPDTLP